MTKKPTVSKFHQLVVEIETATKGTYEIICGIKSRSISRSTNIQTAEVPRDCEDESLGLETRKSAGSQNVTISASGFYTKENGKKLYDWWNSKIVKKVRIHHVQASATGDLEYETGEAYLTQFDNAVSMDGDALATADITIEFDGVPAATYKT